MISTDKKPSDNGQKPAAQIMQTSLQFLPLIINNIPQAVFWKDRNLVFLGCNQAFADSAGLSSPEEIIGKTDFDMPWKEQASLYQADDRRVMESGKAKLNYEEPQTTPDGSIIWLRTSKIPMQENGETVAVVGIFEDITEQKRAEESLQKSEDNLSSALRVAQMGHWEFDLATQMFTFNDQYYSLHGTTAQEVGGYQMSVQRFAQEFVYPEDGPTVGQATQQAIETTDPNFQVQIEARILRKNGEVRWVTVWFSIEKDAQGRTIKLHGVNQDIMERKQAEKALIDSEAQLRSLFEQSTDAILLLENGIFTDCNQATVRMMRAANKEEFLSLHPSRLSPEYQPDGRLSSEKADEMMRTALEKGSNRFEWIHRRADGADFPVEVLLTSISTGNRQLIHTVWRDITERKRPQQEIQTAFERRGLQVQLSTQVSQSIAAAANLEELYERVVTQVKEQFGYYYTQLLRYDAAQEAVILVTGYDEVGAKMLAAGHRLPMGEGLIGTAAATGETILRPTLENDPDWHPNPLLPQTKGEIAVPIRLGNAILGVLDVQSNVAGALNTDDQLLLEGLCGQIATAIESTRLREEMSERLEEINRLYRAMSHEAWQTYRESQNIATGFMFDQAGLRPVKDIELTDELFANIPLVVPGGEVIGSLAIAEDPQRPISADDEAFLQQVSEQVALALESARLFEQTQSALATTQESEERLSEALNIARLAHWEYDVEKDIFTFNDHFYSIFHTTADQVGGYALSSAQYVQLFVHPDDAAVVGNEIGKALASTDRHFATKLEHRILFAEGGVGHVAVEVHVERDENGKIIRWYGANQDITERKTAEEILRVSEARLSEALNIAKLANWEYDFERDRFIFNDHFYSIFHTTAEQVGGYELSSADYAQLFVHPDDAALVGNEIGKAVASTDRYYTAKLEHRILFADGGVGYISVDVHIERDEAGKITRWYGANQDITERKKAEEVIRLAQQRAQIILESVTTPMVITRLSDNHLTFVNAPAIEVTQFKYEDVINQPSPNFYVNVEDRKNFVTELRANGRVSDMVVQLRRENGEAFWALLSARIFDYQGEASILTTFMDITDRIHAQEAVAKRATELATVAQVSTTASTVLDPGQLLQSVVDLTKERFGLYHAHIYLLNPLENALVLTAGSGEVGVQMLGQGWSIPVDHELSIIADAYRRRQSVVANDVHHDKESTFLSNRLLPDTRSETAVPLIVGDQVLGVFDVQSEKVNYFTAEDINIYTTLASQVAVSLQNARLFEQTQSALATTQQSEERLSEALKIARLAHWEYDFEKDLFTFNDHFYSIFHTTAEQVGGYQLSSAQYVQLFVYPDDAAILGNEIGRALASTDRHFSANVEHRILFADGGIGYASVEVHMERDENGKITRWYGANQDITERRQAEEILRVSEARLSEALDIARLANWEYDVEKDLFTFNDHFYSIFHTTAKQVGGYQLSSTQYAQLFVHPDDVPLVGIEIGKALSSTDQHYTVKLEHRILFAGGGVGYISVEVHVERDKDGKITRFYGANQDITERKQAEQIIAQRALQLETVAAVSTTASTVLDPDPLLQSVVDLTKERFGLYHAHIYLADESWQTLLLAAGAGEVGRKLVAEKHAIPMSIELSLVARAARERKAVIVNDVTSEPGFLPNPLLPETCAEMAVPMIVGDKVLGVFDVQSSNVAGFSDEDAHIYVTLATQVGVALQNARLYMGQAATLTQLRELDKLKSSFLANMSHELRTPLNSILGFTDVMLEELDGPLTEHMDNDLRLIQKNGQHLLHLINDVLDMAKIEAGRMNLNPESFQAQEVLEEVTSITSTLASEKNLSLYIQEDSDKDVKIYADRTRLRQVMINLVNNAIKFTDKGKIILNIAQIDGARILISVKDTGIGIPPEKLEAIFQEFTQVDSSSTRKAGGTGLGLPISRRLVEMHGGRLWAESTGIPGEGSTFFVELPIEARITEIVEKQAS